MSVSALMNLGVRAMAANYAALQATGNNIANASTKGYSRQSVELETAGGQFTGAGFFGKGVNVTTVARAHSDFLTREAVSSRSVAAADEARSSQLSNLEKVFDTGESGVGYAAGQFLNAFVDVANNPQDASARQVVLSDAADLAARFSDAGRQIGSIQQGVTADLKSSIGSLNDLAQRVAQINDRIAGMKGLAHQPNDLLDQRDQLISEISQYAQVSTVPADDGSVNVFIGGGQPLVLGVEVTKLVAMPDVYDSQKVHVGTDTAAGKIQLDDGVFTGGSMAGLLRFQNEDLTDARNLLGQMASALSGAVNQQQALGLDQGQPARAGVPIFSVDATSVRPSTRNALAADGNPLASYVDAGGKRVSSVGMTVVDPSRLQASDYELRSDPANAGQYLLTRLSDGQQRSIAPGDVVDGFRVDVASPAPAAGDRFLLQPVGGAAAAMRRVLEDPTGIAAAAPVTATVGSGNTGTATIDQVHATSTTADFSLTTTISFNSDSGDFAWEQRDPSTNALMSSGNGSWKAGQPIELNGWSLSLNGVPRNGDTVSVAKTAFPAASNGNARAMTDLRDALLVGAQDLGNGSVRPGETITDAYASAMSDIGVRVQSAKTTADISSAVATEAESARSEQSGVNLDEEAARLIQFQQSYQAAAKMLQVAQSVFDTLLQATSH